jgi:hypothetical protein
MSCHGAALVACLATFGCILPAAAVPIFPSDAQWEVVERGGSVLTDPSGDISVGAPERDAIGTISHPAAFFYSDGTYAFFRLRVLGNPSGALDGWGVEISTDGNANNYEKLLLIDKTTALEVWRNSVQSNSPGDTAETLLTSTSLAANTRTLSDGNGNFFVDFAAAYTDLAINSSTPLQFVFGTNSNGLPSFPGGSSSDIVGNGALWSEFASDTYFLSESTATSVSEPSSWSLILTGFIVVFLLRFYRKEQVAVRGT